VQTKRGQHVAAVATGRKLAVLIWHLLTKNESYLWARPALHARKLRDLELRAGHKPARGQKGNGPRLQPEKPARPGTALGRAGRGRLRAFRRWLETEGPKGAHGRRKGGTMIRAARQSLHLVPCSSPRGRPCAMAD
jgi:hypothetical protein